MTYSWHTAQTYGCCMPSGSYADFCTDSGLYLRITLTLSTAYTEALTSGIFPSNFITLPQGSKNAQKSAHTVLLYAVRSGVLADDGQINRWAANCTAAGLRPASRDTIKPVLTVFLIIPYAEQSTFRNCHFAD